MALHSLKVSAEIALLLKTFERKAWITNISKYFTYDTCLDYFIYSLDILQHSPASVFLFVWIVNQNITYYVHTQQDNSLKLNILFLITFLVFVIIEAISIVQYLAECDGVVLLRKWTKKDMKKSCWRKLWGGDDEWETSRMWKEILLTQFRKCYLLLLLLLSWLSLLPCQVAKILYLVNVKYTPADNKQKLFDIYKPQ